MKKVISLLLAAMTALSLTVVNVSAAAGNVRISADKAEYETTDTIAIKISSLEKDIATEGFNVEFDESKVTYKRMALGGADVTRASKIKVTRFYDGDKSDTETVSFSIAGKNATKPKVAFGFANTESTGYLAQDEVVTVEFTINDGATGDIKFILNENTDGTTGYVGVADTLTVKVKGSEPAGPVDTSTAVAGRKVWTIENVATTELEAGKTIKLTNHTQSKSVEKEITLDPNVDFGDGGSVTFNLYTDVLNAISDVVTWEWLA